jgi:hypothetical protein
VGNSEAYAKGGSHFHTAKKLSTTSRWRAIGKLEKCKCGIYLNISADNPKNYYSAYSYVVKEDPDFLSSPGFIDLSNADALASTSATRRSKKVAQASKNM